MLLEIRQDRASGGLTTLAQPVQGVVFEGRAARVHTTDDPLLYGGGRKEFRDLAGLQEIADGLNTRKPYTFLHPDGLVSRGAAADIVGQVIGARVDGDYVVVQILVTDARGITAIRDGVHELSLGYTCRLDSNGYQRGIVVDHLAGVPRARCGPTCALRADRGVDEIRTDCGDDAGCHCNFRANSYTVVTVGDQPNSDGDLSAHQRHELPSSMFAAPATQSLPLEDESHVRDAMARFNQTNFKGPAEKKAAYHHIVARAHQLGIDPSGFEKKSGNMDQGLPIMDELTRKLGEALAELAAVKARADQNDTELQTLRAEVQTVKTKLVAAEVEATNARASLDAANSRADKAESDAKVAIDRARLDASEALTLAASERANILVNAARILGPEDRTKLSSRSIKLAVIKHVDNIDVADDKVDEFVDGVYAGALKRADSASTSAGVVRQAIQTPNPKLVPTPAADAERQARKEYADRKRTRRA